LGFISASPITVDAPIAGGRAGLNNAPVVALSAVTVN